MVISARWSTTPTYSIVVLQVILEHFKQIPVKEKEVLTFFIYTVKSHSNKLDSGDR